MWVSEDKLTVTHGGDFLGSYQCVRGSAPITTGVCYWEISVDKLRFVLLSIGGLSKYSSQNPLPPSLLEYYLSINFWPIFSKIKEISVDEYYFFEIPDPPSPLFEY